MRGVIANNPRFRIITETEDYLVVDKPAPLKVHPNGPSTAPTLYDELRGLLAYELQFGGQVSIINRLDRETSGVTLVAKNAETASRFGKAMHTRQFHKTYVAIVHGWPDWDALDFDGPILRKGEVAESIIHIRQTVHPDGALCRTLFRVLERIEKANGKRFAVIVCQPITGRMHQLRVHLSHLGFPIVGDKMYGRDETCYLEFMQTGWTPALEEKLILKRQALHSTHLELEGVGAWDAVLPDDMRAFLDKE